MRYINLISAIFAVLAIAGSAQAQSRTKLTTPTTFYVATTGSDSSGCGLTSAAPCQTRQYLYNSVLAPNYDAGGQTITVQLAAGTYPDTLSMSAPLVGQSGPVVFTGDCTPGNTSHVLIQPTARSQQGGAYFFSGYGTNAQIQCQKIDHSKILIPVWSPNWQLDGADMIAVQNGASLTIGNRSLFGQYADVTLGCNIGPWATIMAPYSSYFTVVNDLNVDTTLCDVTTSASVSSGSSTISVGATTGIVVNMGIVGPNLPIDAFVASVGTNSVVMACIRTNPCVASASGSGSATFFGGGMDFIIQGNGAQSFFDTGIGDPNTSIVINFQNYYEALQGFTYLIDLASMNAGFVTFANAQNVRGACMTLSGNAVFQSYNTGEPYFPCNGMQAEYGGLVNAVAQNDQKLTFQTANFPPAPQFVGLILSDTYSVTASFTAGSLTMSVSSVGGIAAGDAITGPGILTGARVASVGAGTLTLAPCATGGSKCVSNSPLYLTETNAAVIAHGTCLAPGTKVIGWSPATFNIMPPAIGNCAAGTQVQAWGQAQDNAIYH